MPRHASRLELVQGTLELLILKTLAAGPQHGHGISVAIRSASNDTLLVEHGSLYPALHRLEQRGWLRAEWGLSGNNRRAKFYKLTAAGRKRLTAQERNWAELVHAIGRVLATMGSRA